MSKIIRGNKVVYIGLDSLADATVGSAIGSIMLATSTGIPPRAVAGKGATTSAMIVRITRNRGRNNERIMVQDRMF